MAGRLALVPPRFGPQVVGGSEAVMREIATGMAGRGWEVDVMTTCAVNHYTWANELPEGTTYEDGVTVHRFSTVHHTSRTGLEAQVSIQNGRVPPLDDQWTWVGWPFSVPDLFHHLLRHAGGYDAVLFSPYLFWNTTACLAAVPDNAIVMPCLHDETYARLDIVRPALAEAKSVWFLSEPEHQLAHHLGPVAARHTVTGAGVNFPAAYDLEGFRSRHGIEGPFVLYAGRRESGKGWSWLVETYTDALDQGGPEVDLVTIGVGESVPEDLPRGRVIDLGFVSDQERNDAFAAALAYVQPSRMESFSRTVMEAWLAETPVLVVEGSEVVSWHCEKSGGGAAFGDGRQLAELLSRLVADPGLAAGMAAGGKRYVTENFAWPVVLDRMEADLVRLKGTPTA